MITFANDDFFLIGHSVFSLHEKYYTINKIKFFKPETEEEELNSYDITEKLKEKNKNIPLFSANLLLALTKNLKFCYINLDSLLHDTPANLKNHKMVMFDKIYGQQSFLTCSKIYPFSKSSSFIGCLTEFRTSYCQQRLN